MSSNSVRSAERTLSILRYLADAPQPVSATRIMSDCGIPRSSGFHLLNVMWDLGFVVYYPEERKWGLGQTASEIGSSYFRIGQLDRLAKPVLSRLAAATQETAHLGVLLGREVLYVAKRQPERPLTLVTEVGVRLPAHLTAIGKALLMHEPESHVRALFPDTQELVDRTGRGPGSLRELLDELAVFRDRGYAEETGQTTRSISCIAAPAFDADGLPAAAVGISFWTPSYDARGRRELAALVRSAADELSSHLWSRGARNPAAEAS